MVWFAFSTDLDSGRRPQRSHAKNEVQPIRVPDLRTPGLCLWISVQKHHPLCGRRAAPQNPPKKLLIQQHKNGISS